MKFADCWRVDSWWWKERKLLLLLRGIEDGDYMAPVGDRIRRGTYADGWPDARAARFSNTDTVQCESAAAALERVLQLGGFRRPLGGGQTSWKVHHYRIVDTLERFRGVDAFILNARATLARKGELSPKMTVILKSSIHRLRGPWAD